jgi:hypothetical protein
MFLLVFYDGQDNYELGIYEDGEVMGIFFILRNYISKPFCPQILLFYHNIDIHSTKI